MTDWIEVTALIAGPVLAVGLTLWREQARQKRERKLDVMRQLLLTRMNASDPAFTIAVNLTPIEFGHDDRVMTYWEDFTKSAAVQKATQAHLDNLAKAMMLSLGYSQRAASQVARESYTSTGLAEQRNLWAGVLRGILRVAESSEQSASAATRMADHVTGGPIAPAMDLHYGDLVEHADSPSLKD